MTNIDSPLAAYQHALEKTVIQPDAAQARAAQILEDCHVALHQRHKQQRHQQPIAGVYLWGPVGRGKTWLMDIFHQSLQIPSRRQHFHHFMRWVHRRLFNLTGTVDPLSALARELASEVRVLCFDELFVSDIGDAMLLGRLFQMLFEQGVVLVTTSNQAPQQLYTEGYNRQRFLPAITAIERHMHIVEVDGGQDHRLHPGTQLQRYWVRQPHQPNALEAVFTQLAADHPVSTGIIMLGSRRFNTLRHCDVALWCRFSDLCQTPLSAMDFIALCDRFPTLMISDVPQLGGRRREAYIARGTEDGVEQVSAGDRLLPDLAYNDDAVRRFIMLVDECYDRHIPVYLEAEVPLEVLYTEGFLEFSFRRTLSRLREMQLARFGER